MVKKIIIITGMSLGLLVTACKTKEYVVNSEKKESISEKKIVVY